MAVTARTDPVAIFRVAASPQVGGGHLIRCAVLAERLAQTGWHCILVADIEGRALAERYGGSWRQALFCPASDNGCRHPELPRGRVGLAVIDHNCLDADSDLDYRHAGAAVLRLDDQAHRSLAADILLNQNVGVEASLYAGKLPQHCQILIGPNYALLRPAFLAARPSRPPEDFWQPGAPLNLLVSMGLTDPVDATSRALTGLAALTWPLNLTVMLSAAAPYLENVRNACDALRKAQRHGAVDLVLDILDPAPYLARADLVISAAGGSTWERACLGKPAIVVPLVPDQERNAHFLAEQRAAIILPAPTALTAAHFTTTLETILASPDCLRDMGRANYRICDGRGIDRVVAALERYLRMAHRNGGVNVCD